MYIIGNITPKTLTHSNMEFLNNNIERFKNEDILIVDFNLDNSSLNFTTNILDKIIKNAKSVRVASSNNDGVLKILASYYDNLYVGFENFKYCDKNVVFNPNKICNKNDIAIISRNYTNSKKTINGAFYIIDYYNLKTTILSNYLCVGSLFYEQKRDANTKKGIYKLDIINDSVNLTCIENNFDKKWLLVKENAKGEYYLGDELVSDITSLMGNNRVFLEKYKDEIAEDKPISDVDAINFEEYLSKNLSKNAVALFNKLKGEQNITERI